MKQRVRFLLGSVVLMAMLCCAGSAWAQGNAAMLTGTVTDKTGAVIPGATVVLIDEASGVQRKVQSDERGFFSLVGVPVSVYDLKVSAQGFDTLQRKGIPVHINDQLELKAIALPVSGATTSVVVTAESDEMTPTSSGEVSYTISDNQLHNLNLEGRSAIELLGLIPGSGNTGNFNGTYSGASAGFTQNSSTFTVNGNRFDQVSLVSDGASVSDLNTAGSAAVTPNVDMISELKVESSAYSAAEPNGPIVVSAQTKSGGREFHGLLQLTARDHSLNANDWQQKYYSLAAPQTSLYYPAFQLGGPVALGKLKDKLFFFAATEISQQHVDLLPRKSQVPTAAMKTGDFTDTTYLGNLSNTGNGWIGWPVATQPCSGSYYSTSCVNTVGYGSNWGHITNIDKGGQALLNAIPLPNVDPSTHNGYNLITDITVSQPRNQETLKLDYAISDNTHASARYNHENESVPSPYGPWNTWNNVPYPVTQNQKNASDSLNLQLTNILNASLTNEASLSGTRFTLKTALSNMDAANATALGYSYSGLFATTNPLLPNLSFEKQAGGLYIAGGEAPPYLGAQNNCTFNDGVTYLKGTHLFRAGFYGQMARYNGLTTGTDNGSVTMTNWDAVTGNDWADLLIGNVNGYSQSSANLMADMRAIRYDFFAQDTWKATKKLTLNYGVRVDHLGWWYDAGNRIAVFNPADDVDVKNQNYTSYSGMETHATNSKVSKYGAKALGFQYAPSAGFAYDVNANGKTVVRGGFGTNYYNDPGNDAYSGIMAPPNFKAVTMYASSGTYTLAGLSKLSYGTQPPTVWGTANPSDHLAPVTYSWNLAVSHIFWGANKVEANYVGNSSHNLVGFGVRNAVPEGAINGTYYGQWYEEQARPYQNFGDIATHMHNLNSNYNAAQLTVTREKGWLNYWGSYTFGKSLAYNAEDAYDMKRWYGPTPFDRSQILSFSYFLKLPAVSQKYLGNYKAVNEAVDGWQISGIFQAMTGGPIGNNLSGSEYSAKVNQISIWDGGNYADFADGTPDEVPVPKMICDPRKGLAKNQYFNPACFTGPTRLSNGTYRLPYIHGPAYINDSIGLFKSFTISDKKKLEVRGEAFNLFNHPWNEFIQNDPNMYMGFKDDGTAAASTNGNASAGTAENKTGHRELSVAAKFYF